MLGMTTSTAAAPGLGVEDLLMAGAAAREASRLEDAAMHFEAALALDRQNLFALGNLGLVRMRQGDSEAAARRFDEVLAIAPGDVFALVWRGVLHLREGDESRAEARFLAALDQDPNHADAHYFLGVMRAAAGDSAGAVSRFRKAQRAGAGQGDPETHYRLAMAFLGEGMTANARLELARCLALAPQRAPAWDALGWLLWRQGDSAGAVRTWREGLTHLQTEPAGRSLRVSLATALCRLALEAQQTGRHAEAAATWREALRYDPDNRAARFRLAQLRRQGPLLAGEYPERLGSP